MLVIALAAAGVAAGVASGDPSIDSKRAQAQSVLAQINRTEINLERARTRLIASQQKLQAIEHSLAVNKVGLRAARANLKASQSALMQRLVVIYTSRDDQSTLGVMLGAKSISDLVTRIEAVQNVSHQDVTVMDNVVRFKRQVTAHRHALVRAHRQQASLVHERAAARASIASQLAQHQRLYNSIKGEVAHLEAGARARAVASPAPMRAPRSPIAA